ncbi:hypothetical protein GCM10022220_64540 [Actinocatenispora rupis]|uniref:DUF2568 domain-containing protein n=1 Tax=Actinocatenispora rupis TaxID=519421 RepID=A0A8J3J164_9ACTN|nr:hypothetical protein Aru02nite_35490 [Actinocatenispora rupis]
MNLGLRFLLELVCLAALVYWGWRLPAGLPVRLLAGVLLPVAAAVCWGMFASPRGRWLTVPGRAVCEVGLFGGAAVALAAAGQPVAGVVLAVVAAASLGVTYGLRQHPSPVRRG